MFATRDTWFQHEMQMHRVEYFCNAEAHPVHSNLSNFKDHMQREHDISLKDLTNSAAMNMFRRPVSSSEGICNLCFREEPVKNMKSHVSKHLEQVALFAIPRAEYGEDDVDSGENQSCQAQHNLEESMSQDDWSDTSLPPPRGYGPPPLPPHLHFSKARKAKKRSIQMAYSESSDSDEELKPVRLMWGVGQDVPLSPPAPPEWIESESESESD